jgi:urease accessory protein
MMSGMVRRALLAAAVAILAPGISQAHLVTTGLGPFYDGVTHFVMTPEDLIPALALALFAGLRGSRTGRLALFALPGAWLAGGILGLAAPHNGQPMLLTAISFLALGGLVAADVNLKPGMVLGLAVVLGLAHGYLNGSAMSQAKLGGLGLAGIVASLFVVVALGAAMVASLRAPWARIVVRVAGSWIAAAGLLLLGWTFRGDAARPRAASFETSQAPAISARLIRDASMGTRI